MEGDPSARISPWYSQGEGKPQDSAPVHNSNPAINMPNRGPATSAGTARKEGSQEPSQESADWGDMGESQQPEQRQQHRHSTRYKDASRSCAADLLEGQRPFYICIWEWKPLVSVLLRVASGCRWSWVLIFNEVWWQCEE